MPAIMALLDSCHVLYVRLPLQMSWKRNLVQNAVAHLLSEGGKSILSCNSFAEGVALLVTNCFPCPVKGAAGYDSDIKPYMVWNHTVFISPSVPKLFR